MRQCAGVDRVASGTAGVGAHLKRAQLTSRCALRRKRTGGLTIEKSLARNVAVMALRGRAARGALSASRSYAVVVRLLLAQVAAGRPSWVVPVAANRAFGSVGAVRGFLWGGCEKNVAGGVVRVSFEWGCGDMQGVCSKRACGDESAPKTLAFPTRAPTAGPSNKVVESTNTVAAPVSGARVAALGVFPVLQLVALVPRSVNDVPLLHASVLLMLMDST